MRLQQHYHGVCPPDVSTVMDYYIKYVVTMLLHCYYVLLIIYLIFNCVLLYLQILGRKKETFINIFVLVCKCMSNKCIQNVFNVFL